jgi:hypothetical protein
MFHFIIGKKMNVTVTAIEASEENFARALGITPEREQELDDIMEKAHRDTGTYPDALAMITTNDITPNELAYVAFFLGAFAESARNKHSLLHKLLD